MEWRLSHESTPVSVSCTDRGPSARRRRLRRGGKFQRRSARRRHGRACRGFGGICQAAGLPAEAQEGLPEFYTEEYHYLAENGFHAVSTAPLSTFAADVDTASYANLRRMLLSGQEVPADAVRIEELINYFHYDYPTPEDGAPFSVSAEIAPCPWNGDTLLLRLGLQAPAAGLGGHAPLQPGFSHRRVRLYGEL